MATFPEGVITPFVIGDGTGGYAKVLYVGSTTGGHQTSSSGDSYETPAPTLLSVFKQGVVDSADRGTLIVVRKGHTENISAADYFSLIGARKNITIIGEGEGVERPSFTWTVAGSTWLFDTQGIVLKNCRLFLAGPHAAGTAVTVAAPITVTGAGCAIVGCDIKAGFDADQIVTVGLFVTTGGDSFRFTNNIVRALVAAPMTTFMRLTAVDNTLIDDNEITVATTAAAVGVVQALTTAPTNTVISNNIMNNLKSDSTCAITPIAAQTGRLCDNYFIIQSTGLAHITTGSAMSRFNNYGVNTGADETGALLGTASS